MTIECRGCRKQLAGEYGRYVYDPITKIEAKRNHFNGHVCSRNCDVKVCLEMLSSMPGAGIARQLDSPCAASVKRNWGE